jgi:FAD/FMN-containing dehydrogenase
MMSRAFGLTLDNIVSIQLVKPSGELAVVSDESQGLDKELFWALRGGGGGNFGIVTAYTFKLQAVPELTVYEMRWSYDQFIDVMRYWQQWAPDTVPGLTCQLSFEARDTVDEDGHPMEVHSEGLFLGGPEELKRLLAPWAEKVKPLDGYPWVERKSFRESTEFFATFDSAPHPFKTTGAFAYQNLPEAALQTIVDYLDTAPSKQCGLWMQSFGGVFAGKASGDTAFFHREARFILEFVGSWKPGTLLGEACARWVEGFRDALRDYTRGTYVNFVDLSLSTPGQDKARQQYLEMYYGGNVQRLREIKTRVDPDNVFDFEQSIPLLPENDVR